MSDDRQADDDASESVRDAVVESAHSDESAHDGESDSADGDGATPSAGDGPVADDVLERASDEHPLAVVVDEARTEVAIESLRAEGCYDDGRAVRPYDEGRIALPVDRPPEETRVHEVVRQVDPDVRMTDLDTLLAERGWSEAEREFAPGSWAVVGDVILVTIPPDCPDEDAVADALLDLHGGTEAVLANEGVSGTYREPRTRHLAGETDTETVHVEHGTRYALDPSQIMFSPGNQAERVRMGEIVDSDERVLDMFAGIGYFTLPMARAGAQVTATELNPTAFRYLIENAVANGVTDRVDAYNADCRDVAPELTVDRVVMGYYGTDPDPDEPPHDGASDRSKASPGSGDDDTNRPAGQDSRTSEAHEFLPHALAALEPGGTIHYHEACPENRLPERPQTRLATALDDAGRDLAAVEWRRVKTHSAGVVHVVLDATLE